jgi:uncharacterized protein (DUF983 family)
MTLGDASMIRFWFKTCPACHQGRLFVTVRDDTKELFLECEECSRAWKTPEQVSPTDNAFLAIEIQSHPASAEEIEGGGWSRYHFQQDSA